MKRAVFGTHHSISEAHSAVIELQEKILSAQETQSALVERVSELEKEVTRLKNWEADKSRYELTEIAPGILALSIKESMRNGEPLHRICANCASEGKKSYLQRHPGGPGTYRLRCNVCREEVLIREREPQIGLVGYGGTDREN
jgi:hypothetical protein